jgi:leader peptidase (prepilin peptidase)/N-methyltransferase
MAWVSMSLMGALGLVMGSYAVTAGIRHSRGEQSALGRSHCDHCAQILHSAHTVPVFSYVGLRGHCHACKGRIDPAHLIGECAAGLAFASAAMATTLPRAMLIGVLSLALIAASAVDLKVRRLPNNLTLVIAGLCTALATTHSINDLQIGLIAAAVMGLLLGALRWLSLRLGKDGLGLGDVKLIAALAIWLGAATPWMIALSAVLGLLAILVIRPIDGRIAFGPAIALAAFAIGILSEAGAWPIP